MLKFTVTALLTAGALSTVALGKSMRPATMPSNPTTTMPATAPATQASAYPLNYCIVSDEKFGGDMGEPVTINHDGQEVKFCCEGCVKMFKKNPEKYLKKIEAAAASSPEKKAG